MRSALQAKCLCLAILSGIVGTASGADVDATSNNRVGVSEEDIAIHAYEPGTLKPEPQRGDTIPDYDPEGNRTDRVAGSATRTYDYDRENRLLSVTEGSSQWRYDYDYRTRRVMREENGQPERISFSGGTSVQEYRRGLGGGIDGPSGPPGGSESQAGDGDQYASNYTPTVEYIRGSDMGGGIGGILYSVRGDTASFAHYNARGDVVAKSGSTGALTWQARYEGFGSRTSEIGTNPDKQRANTREEEPWGGLYENMRWRDLETGQYFTRDPAGFVDGPNLYAYVNQNPWTAFDPLGLEGVTAIKPEVTRPVHHRPPSGSSAVRAAAGRAAVSNPAAAAATGFVATGVAGSMAGTAAVSQLHHAKKLRQQAGQPQPAAYGNSTARAPQSAPQPAPQPVNAPPPAPPQPDGDSSKQILVGQTMQRVKLAQQTRFPQAEIMPGINSPEIENLDISRTHFQETITGQLSEAWISGKMADGYQILDLGWDSGEPERERRLKSAYQAESQAIERVNYPTTKVRDEWTDGHGALKDYNRSNEDGKRD